MKPFRLFSVALFLLGIVALVVAVACGGDDKPKQQAATAAPTDTATATATSTPTPPPTPTATPTPFNGAISRFKMPSQGVDAPIEELGVNANNEMETPTRENTDVGWYKLWDRPGWDGNAVFSAHVYYHNIPAPFVKLAKSQEGDDIYITMENGAEYHYKVISNKRYNRDTIPMGDIIWPKDRPADKQWITMITCGGELDSTGWEYISRDVIVAERVA